MSCMSYDTRTDSRPVVVIAETHFERQRRDVGEFPIGDCSVIV